MKSLEEFKKSKDFLICFDSDGCVLNTMEAKQRQCFGPCLIKVWCLEEWEQAILDRWFELNLYSWNRAINRFINLSLILDEINSKYHPINGIEELKHWVKETPELSTASVKRQADKTGLTIFKDVWRWSTAINESVSKLSFENKLPFSGVERCLKMVYQEANTAIITATNPEAVQAEWRHFELLKFIDVCLAHDLGNKSYCINKLMNNGYQKDRAMMIGDSPGDYVAAIECGILFYPILVNEETESWRRFEQEAFPKFVGGIYDGLYQHKLLKEFKDNFGKFR